MHGLTQEEYDEVLDYGNWNYGLLPGYDGPVTACITLRNRLIPSYVDEHENYRETLFADTIKSTWGPAADKTVFPERRVPEAHYAVAGDEYHFPEGELKYIGSGLNGATKRFEYAFCQELKHGRIEVPAPVLIKGFLSDVLIHEDYVAEFRETYLNYATERREEEREAAQERAN